MKKTVVVLLALLGIALIWSGCTQTAVTSARVYIQQQNYEQAAEQGKLAVKTNPNDPDAYQVLGEAYGLMGEYRLMNENFNKSLEISPKHAAEIERQKNKYYVDLFNAGTKAIKQNNLDEAEEDFILCTEISPDRSGAYTNLALVYTLKEETDKAIETYQEAVKLEPQDTRLKVTLGKVYYRAQNYEKAIEVFKKVLEQAEPGSEDYGEALMNTAYSYDLMGDSEKAIDIYMKALDNSPDDKDLWYNLGRLHFMQDSFDKAIEAFREVIRLAPDDFEANLNVGQALLEMEKYEEAVPFYEKAVEINPESMIAWNNLGIAYVRTGQPEKGKEAFDRAEALNKAESEEGTE